MATTSSALNTQGRVILALMMREVHTLYGGRTLGYLWSLFKTAFGICIFWVVRVCAHFSAPHGMHVLMYLIAGFGIWNIFSQTLNKCMAAVEGNRALLTFPQVTPLDIMVARAVLIAATQIVSMILIAVIASFFGVKVELANLGLLLASVSLAMMLGLGFGVFLGSLAVYLPVLQQIVPMATRIMFFMSGVFISVDRFTAYVGDTLLYNPVLHLVELTRMALASGYMYRNLDVLYVLEVTFSVLFLGLLLERYIRRKVTQ